MSLNLVTLDPTTLDPTNTTKKADPGRKKMFLQGVKKKNKSLFPMSIRSCLTRFVLLFRGSRYILYGSGIILPYHPLGVFTPSCPWVNEVRSLVSSQLSG